MKVLTDGLLLSASFWSQDILLGLTVQEFLLHLLNFVILVVALRLLLYKPVKKFMEKRKEEYEQAEEKYQGAVKMTEEAEKNAEKVLDEAREEAVKIAEEAHALAMVQTEEILLTAREEADSIVKKAKEEAEQAKKKEMDNLYYSVSDLAVNISEKLLGRELKGEDNDVFIDNLLENMKKKDSGEGNA